MTVRQHDATLNSMRLSETELLALKNRADLLIDGDQVATLYLDNLFQTQDRLATRENEFLNVTTRYAIETLNRQRALGLFFRTYQPHSLGTGVMD